MQADLLTTEEVLAEDVDAQQSQSVPSKQSSNDNKHKYIAVVLAFCWISYFCAYLGRLGYTANLVNITTKFSYTKSQAGYAATAFAIFYGAGQFINGVLCNKYNTKLVFAIGLLGSAVSNALLLNVNLPLMVVCWGFNGLMQSCLWCNIIKLIAENSPENKRSSCAIVIGLTCPAGTFVVYGLSALFTKLGIFELTFYLSSALLVLSAILFLIFVRPIKKRATIETNKTDESLAHTRLPFRQIFVYVLLPISIIAIVNNFVKDGTQGWLPNLLTENFGFAESKSILITLLLPLVSVFSSLIVVAINRKTRNNLITSVFMCIIGGIGLALSAIFYTFPIVMVVGFCITIFSMSAINSIITSHLPLSLHKFTSSGSISGVIDAFCYAGSALCYVIPPLIIDSSGYRIYVIVMLATMGIAFISSFIGSFILNKKFEAKGYRDLLIKK